MLSIMVGLLSSRFALRGVARQLVSVIEQPVHLSKPHAGTPHSDIAVYTQDLVKEILGQFSLSCGTEATSSPLPIG
jgi:hypothetical protein